MARLSRALGAPYPADALYDLAQSLGAPAALKDIGMPKEGVERAVAAAIEQGGWNPRALDRPALERMLRRAWAGERPRIERSVRERLSSL